MDAILTTLGVMGLGAIVISSYVFLVAARNYVSEDRRSFRANSLEPAPQNLCVRSSTDRRGDRSVTFPLTVNGILITSDRRTLPDRRSMA
jgi:hypothetical protein